MKKNKLSLLLLCALMASSLNGCNFTKKAEETPMSENDAKFYVKKTGIISESNSDKILTTDGNEIFLLKSIFVNLNDTKYISAKVEVIGLEEKSKTTDPNILEVEKITLLEESKKEVWENYDAKRLGIKIDFPKDVMDLKEKENLLEFTKITVEATNKDESQFITVNKIENKENQTLEDYLVKNLKINKEDLITSEIGKNNLSAFKIIDEEKGEVSFFVNNSTFFYKLTHKSNIETDKSQFRSLFYNMIYTFEIIEVSDPKTEKTTIENVETQDPASQGNDAPKKEDAKTKDTKKAEEPVKEVANEPKKDDVETQNSASQNKKETASNLEANTLNPLETPTNLNENYKKVADHIKITLANYAIEQDATKIYTFDKLEFVDPDLVYVEYYFPELKEKRKTLLRYNINEEQVSGGVQAQYKKGENKDWEKVSGQDPAVNKAKEVVSVSDDGQLKSEMKVQEGYRYFESVPHKFKMQIPINWYYAGAGGHFGFSNKPVEDNNQLVQLDILGTSVEQSSTDGGNVMTIQGKKAILLKKDNLLTLYLEKTGGKSYKFYGDSSQESIILKIAETVID